MRAAIHTIELAVWDLDEYEFRPADVFPERTAASHTLLSSRELKSAEDVICEEETCEIRDLLDEQRSRADLQMEMRGLVWSLGVVDLRPLLAFQRRLSFTGGIASAPCISDDWQSLIDLAFARSRRLEYTLDHDPNGSVILQSNNPNMHLGLSGNTDSPFTVQGGSPFFEVARFRDRWFLRDGYHRAYALLRAGIFKTPAVIVHAKTLHELGATQPWFFSESVLFSKHPPLVSDFLESSFTIEYDRPPTITTIRLSIHTSQTIDSHGDLHEHCNETR